MQITACDCGKRKLLDDDEFVKLGIAQKIYCKGECEEKVTEFLDARDAIHDSVVKKWNKDLKALYKNYPDFQMPDEYPLSS